MTKELWAAVALSFLVTMSSVLASEDTALPGQQKSAPKAQSKTVQPLQDQDVESGCSERFNPFRLKYADTADQDICAS